ncbi:MAG TPA: hypothetical protein VF807_00075 [Ktedonobacterales bacterium]
MRRVLDFLTANLKKIVLVIVLLPLIAVGVSLLLPRSYQSVSTLWALRRYSVIGATGPESDLQSTPAMTQANALVDLLQTRSFDLDVARKANLAAALGSPLGGKPDDDALVAEVSGKVKVLAVGANLYSISYANKKPNVAQALVQAVLDGYSVESVKLSISQAQHTLDVYKQQQASAQAVAQSASKAEAQYLGAHPELKGNGLLLDPQYTLLHAQSQQAAGALEAINTKIGALVSDMQTLGSDSSSLYTVVDAPSLPTRAQSRTTQLAIAGVAGLLVALIGVALYVTLGLRRDQSVHDAEELQSYLDIPVLVSIPHQLKVSAKQRAEENGHFALLTLHEED